MTLPRNMRIAWISFGYMHYKKPVFFVMFWKTASCFSPVIMLVACVSANVRMSTRYFATVASMVCRSTRAYLKTRRCWQKRARSGGRLTGHPGRRRTATLARQSRFTEGKFGKVTGVRGRMQPGCKKKSIMGSGLQEQKEKCIVLLNTLYFFPVLM